MLASLTPEGGLALALVRALSVAGLLSVFGTLAFRVVVVPRLPEAGAVGRRLVRLAWLGLGVQLGGTLAWLVLQAGDMAGTVAAAPAVLAETAFGHLVAAQVVAMAAVAAAVGRGGGTGRQRVAFALAGAGVALQAGHGHAAAMTGGMSGVLLAAGVVHLLAAGAWLGGLVPLMVAVAGSGPKGGALAARWFAPMGRWCVAGVAASAVVQGWWLVGSVPGLVGTGYGWMVLVKAGLFAGLVGFALANRYRFAPALLRGGATRARRVLLGSVGVQTGVGVAVVVAASVLASLAPSVHVAPVWPFAERPSLAAVSEDAGLRDEAAAAGLALGVAVAAAAGAVAMRRRGLGRGRWGVLAAAAGVAWLAVPHLDLLLVPAYPTSFQRSPTGFSAGSVVAGAALYPGQCAGCHGEDGHGDGGAAQAPGVMAADLTAGHLWMHADGELFWWLAHGIEAPEGGMAMPGFVPPLSDGEVWALIDFVRAHNAGLVVREAGVWSPPLAAPGFWLRCEDGRMRTLADLRGGFVRVVLGQAAAVPGVVTVMATADPLVRPGPGLCVAEDAAVPAAYRVVAGLAPGVSGAQVLVDGAGWLRAVQADGAGWDDPARLAATVRQLAAAPVGGTAGAGGGDARMRM